MDDTRTECSMEEPSELEKTKRRSSSKKTISPRGTSKSSGSRSEGGSSNGETKITKRYLNEPKYSVVHNVNNEYAKNEVQRMETIQQVESDDSIVRTDTDIGIYAHEEESAVGASLAPTQDAAKAPLYGDSSRQSQKGGINNFIDMSAGIDEVLLSESLTKEEVIEGAKADDAGVAVESLVMDDIGASFVGLMRQYNLNEDPGVESQMQRRKAVDQHNARQGHVGPSIMGHFANSLQTFQREHHLTDTLPEHQTNQHNQINRQDLYLPFHCHHQINNKCNNIIIMELLIIDMRSLPTAMFADSVNMWLEEGTICLHRLETRMLREVTRSRRTSVLIEISGDLENVLCKPF
eukprot:g5099.t1 g5099   contig18:631538-632587(-)